MRRESSQNVPSRLGRAVAWVGPWAVLAAVLAAVYGQYFLEHKDPIGRGIVALCAAGLLFLASMASLRNAFPSRHLPAGEMRAPACFPRAVAWGAAWVCLLASGVAFLGSGGNRFTLAGTVSWVVAMLSFGVATAECQGGIRSVWERVRRSLQGPWRLRIPWRMVALMAIYLLGIYFRFHMLDDVPRELGSDHAEKLLDIYDVLQGQRPIFFPRNTGREPMQFYITYALIKYAGFSLDFMALKVGTAAIGSLALLAVFLLVREAFNEDVGLIAMLLVAVSQWHVGISRMGLRYPFPSLWATLAVWFLLRAIRYHRRSDFVLCGAMTGVGLYTYIPCRVVPLVVGSVLALHLALDLRARRADVKRYLVNCALCGLAALVVFLPLLRYMLDFPDVFWFRAVTRATGAEQALATSPWLTLLHNFKNALLAFNVWGDQVPVTVIPVVPLLDFISGGLFALGFLWVLVKALTGKRMAQYWILAFVVFMLPSVLSLAYPGENPSAVRMGAAIPYVYGFAALAVYGLVQALQRLRPALLRWPALVILMMALVVGLVGVNYHRYFVLYDSQYRSWSPNTSEIGAVVRDFAACCGEMEDAYHVAWPYWADTRNIGIVAGDITWSNLLSSEEAILATVDRGSGAKLYVLHLDDTADAELLAHLFPQGTLRRYVSDTPGHDFWVFFVPAAE